MKNISIKAEFFNHSLDNSTSIKFLVSSETSNWEVIRTWDHFCFFMIDLKNSIPPHPKSTNGLAWSDESLTFHISTSTLPTIEQLNSFLSSLIQDRGDVLLTSPPFLQFFENTDKTIANILDKLKSLSMMEQSITSLDSRINNITSTNEEIFHLVNSLYNSHTEELRRKENKRLKKKIKKNEKIQDSSSSSSSSFENVKVKKKESIRKYNLANNNSHNLQNVYQNNYKLKNTSSFHHLNSNSETDVKNGVSSLSQSSVSDNTIYKDQLLIDNNLNSPSFDLNINSSPASSVNPVSNIPKKTIVQMLLKKDSIKSIPDESKSRTSQEEDIISHCVDSPKQNDIINVNEMLNNNNYPFSDSMKVPEYNNKMAPLNDYDEEDEDDIDNEFFSLPYLSRVKPTFSNEWKELVEHTVNSFIESFQPTEFEVENYQKILKYLRRLTRTSLGTSIYEAGLHALGCNLPGDTMRFTVIVNHNQNSSWVTILYERLKKIMLLQQALKNSANKSKTREDIDNELSKLDDQNHLENTVDSDRVPSTNSSLLSDTDKSDTQSFLINDLYINNDKQGGFKLIFTIDGQPIEIVANARSDLIMLAFFSEFSMKIDSNNLFRRSVILAKLWWNSQLKSLYIGFNDTYALAHNKLVTFINDITLVFLLTSVMNTNNLTNNNSNQSAGNSNNSPNNANSITSPLQNLFFLIQRLACFDSQKYCLTLQGYTKFDKNSNSPRDPTVNKLHKCSKKMIHHYISLSFPFDELIFPLNDGSVSSISQVKTNSVTSNNTNILSSINQNANTTYYSNVLPINLISSTSLKSNVTKVTPNTSNFSSNISLPLPIITTSITSSSYASSYLSSPSSLTILYDESLHFERYDFNVLNPFNKTNMIKENLSKSHRSLFKHFFYDSSYKIFEIIDLLSKNFIGLIEPRKDALRKEIIEKLQGYLISLADPVINPLDHPKVAPFISLNPSIPPPLSVLSMRNILINLNNRFSLLKSNLDKCYKFFNQVDLTYFNDKVIESPKNEKPNSSNFKPVFSTNPVPFPSINLNDIWKSIHFANFLLASCLNESSLLTFCVDMLVFKGPLPVGEIGKLLTEGCNIPQVTTKVRDNFGGLKKFLESFNGLFLFSSDHPFNPHVVLRCSLSEDQINSLEISQSSSNSSNLSSNSGPNIPIIPIQWLSKLAPNTIAKKPKSSPSGSNSSPSSSASSIHEDEASVNLRVFHRSVEKTLLKLNHEKTGQVTRPSPNEFFPTNQTNSVASGSSAGINTYKNNSTNSISSNNKSNSNSSVSKNSFKINNIDNNNSDSEISEISNISDNCQTPSGIFYSNVNALNEINKNTPYYNPNQGNVNSPPSSSNSSTHSQQSQPTGNLKNLAQQTLLSDTPFHSSNQSQITQLQQQHHHQQQQQQQQQPLHHHLHQQQHSPPQSNYNQNNFYQNNSNNLISANGFNTAATSFNPSQPYNHNINTYNHNFNNSPDYSNTTFPNSSFGNNPNQNINQVSNNPPFNYPITFPTSTPPNPNNSRGAGVNSMNINSNRAINGNPNSASVLNNNNNNNNNNFLRNQSSNNNYNNYTYPSSYTPNNSNLTYNTPPQTNYNSNSYPSNSNNNFSSNNYPSNNQNNYFPNPNNYPYLYQDNSTNFQTSNTNNTKKSIDVALAREREASAVINSHHNPSLNNYSFPTSYFPNNKTNDISSTNLNHLNHKSNDDDILNDSNSSNLIESVINMTQDNN